MLRDRNRFKRKILKIYKIYISRSGFPEKFSFQEGPGCTRPVRGLPSLVVAIVAVRVGQ